MRTMRFEVKEQVATQDYDCDAVDCDLPIPDETLYVRVARTVQRGTREGRPSAAGVEKFHPSCWERLQ